MSRLGPTREWPRINPLDALLNRDAAQTAGPKVVIIAAHLCDIVAAAGGHLSRWNIGAVVHATSDEACAQAARGMVDFAPQVFCSLGYRRQETPAHLDHLTADVLAVFKQAQPDLVVTQGYDGGDCDRDAVAFAVHHAARSLERPPLIVEMTGWRQGDGLRSLGEFLHRPGVSERSSALTAEEQIRKASLVAAFPELRAAMPAFDVRAEYFRMAPRYDFTRPPHPGPLGYEQAGGRWTGDTWRSQVERVLPQVQVSASAADRA